MCNGILPFWGLLSVAGCPSKYSLGCFCSHNKLSFVFDDALDKPGGKCHKKDNFYKSPIFVSNQFAKYPSLGKIGPIELMKY